MEFVIDVLAVNINFNTRLCQNDFKTGSSQDGNVSKDFLEFSHSD